MKFPIRLVGHALAGVRVQRVQRVQKVQRVVVGGSAASLYKTFIIALAGEGKQANRAYGARKYTPIPLRGLPPKGETTHYICASLTLLQNVFAVHPGGGSLLYAQLLNS